MISIQSVPETHLDVSATETHIERVIEPRAKFSLLERMFIERGDISDWHLLHDLHYKAEKIAAGSRFYRLTLESETIGVLVTACPKGLLKERHQVFPSLRPGAKDTYATNVYRYKYINQNFRVVSRFVVDTMYRGIGAGYRMMNLVSRMEGNTFMEIQSSMSKFNLFGQKAGFKFVQPMNANKYEVGMKFFRNHFDANPQDFEALVKEIESKSPAEQVLLIEQCKDFYAKNSALEKTGNIRTRADRRISAMTHRDIVKAIQQMALASPMYGIWKNPDPGKKVKPKLPLIAFDTQKPNESIDKRWLDD